MNRIDRTGLLTIAAALLILLQGEQTVRACPNCKEAVSLQAEETADLSGGYNWSVIFMLAVPFSMMGTGALAIHRAVKRGTLPEM
jgi:hypothetical protein